MKPEVLEIYSSDGNEALPSKWPVKTKAAFGTEVPQVKTTDEKAVRLRSEPGTSGPGRGRAADKAAEANSRVFCGTTLDPAFKRETEERKFAALSQEGTIRENVRRLEQQQIHLQQERFDLQAKHHRDMQNLQNEYLDSKVRAHVLEGEVKMVEAEIRALEREHDSVSRTCTVSFYSHRAHPSARSLSPVFYAFEED